MGGHTHFDTTRRKAKTHVRISLFVVCVAFTHSIWASPPTVPSTPPATPPTSAPPIAPPIAPPVTPPAASPTAPATPPTTPPAGPPTAPPTSPPTVAPVEPPTAPPTEPPSAAPTPPTTPPSTPPIAPPVAPPAAAPTAPPSSTPEAPPASPPIAPPASPPAAPPVAPPIEPPASPPTEAPTAPPMAPPAAPPAEAPLSPPVAPPAAPPATPSVPAPPSPLWDGILHEYGMQGFGENVTYYVQNVPYLAIVVGIQSDPQGNCSATMSPIFNDTMSLPVISSNNTLVMETSLVQISGPGSTSLDLGLVTTCANNSAVRYYVGVVEAYMWSGANNFNLPVKANGLAAFVWLPNATAIQTMAQYNVSHPPSVSSLGTSATPWTQTPPPALVTPYCPDGAESVACNTSVKICFPPYNLNPNPLMYSIFLGNSSIEGSVEIVAEPLYIPPILNGTNFLIDLSVPTFYNPPDYTLLVAGNGSSGVYLALQMDLVDGNPVQSLSAGWECWGGDSLPQGSPTLPGTLRTVAIDLGSASFAHASVVHVEGQPATSLVSMSLLPYSNPSFNCTVNGSATDCSPNGICTLNGCSCVYGYVGAACESIDQNVVQVLNVSSGATSMLNLTAPAGGWNWTNTPILRISVPTGDNTTLYHLKVSFDNFLNEVSSAESLIGLLMVGSIATAWNASQALSDANAIGASAAVFNSSGTSVTLCTTVVAGKDVFLSFLPPVEESPQFDTAVVQWAAELIPMNASNLLVLTSNRTMVPLDGDRTFTICSASGHVQTPLAVFEVCSGNACLSDPDTPTQCSTTTACNNLGSCSGRLALPLGLGPTETGVHLLTDQSIMMEVYIIALPGTWPWPNGTHSFGLVHAAADTPVSQNATLLVDLAVRGIELTLGTQYEIQYYYASLNDNPNATMYAPCGIRTQTPLTIANMSNNGITSKALGYLPSSAFPVTIGAVLAVVGGDYHATLAALPTLRLSLPPQGNSAANAGGLNLRGVIFPICGTVAALGAATLLWGIVARAKRRSEGGHNADYTSIR